MDRQTIEAAERVTAWSRARAMSAVLQAASQTSTPAEVAQGEEPPLHERSTAALRYLGEQEEAEGAEDQT